MEVIKKIVQAAGVISAIMFVAACSENINTEPKTNTDTDQPMTLSRVQEEIFDRSCAFTGCHAGSSPAAGLNLTLGSSYENLVNVTAVLSSEFKRVNPGNSSDSYLIKMLRNSGPGTRQMPPSGKLNEDIIKLAESWINDGAEKN